MTKTKLSRVRGWFFKLLRGTVSVAGSGLMMRAQSDPKWMLAVPVINGIGKAIRMEMQNKGREDLEKWVFF